MPNLNVFDEVEVETKTSGVKCSFVTGPAGTGKTHQFKKRIEADEDEGVLCATTGVAAINLGTVTLHSTLGFFDTESLADNFVTGRLIRKLISLRKVEGKRSLMIDEASMLDAQQLDIITAAAERANARLDEPISIELTGDFAQLPPINGQWAFKASKWDKYAQNITKLTKIYRQTDEEFLAALREARLGNGGAASELLRTKVKWASGVDLNFSGTTITAKNSDVDKINELRYLKLVGGEQTYISRKWGQQRSEWKNIPDFRKLKVGTYVMILANGYEVDEFGKRELKYVNGDKGEVVEMNPSSVVIRLDRTAALGETITLPFITRDFASKDEPDMSKYPDSYFNETSKKWISGGVTYLPVNLGYAVTVHKSQGLTLEKVQIDPRGHFFGSPNMAYVALSRVRSANGLKIVGTPELLAKRINRDKEIEEWI